MISKTRIAILGIGGVGGYFGGFLAGKYYQSADIEIIFIVRPGTEKIIKEQGLKLITTTEERILFPQLVSSDPNEIGHLDFLICCTKSYDLEESLLRLQNCITGNTIILPLLNGVDARECISKIYPFAEIWEGCVYIVTRLIAPGVVKETGKLHSLYFGSDTASRDKLIFFEKILLAAGIDATLSANIECTLWEKFLFLASIANMTTYKDMTVGEVLKNTDGRYTLVELVKELKSIADAKGIQLPVNIVENTITKIEKLPFDATSSMHSDFQKGGRTEYLSLTEYVTKMGDEYCVATPSFDRILLEFIRRDKNRVN